MTAKKTSLSEQSKAFMQAARELGCDDSEERFVETVRKIAKAPPQHREGRGKGVKARRQPEPRKRK